ncbi:MAG: M42 family metallopeptidase [Planctomycetaceae bacterium]
MHDEALSFLKKMLATPSPSGYEERIQQIVREYAGGFADEVTTDWHGNVSAVVNPTGSPRIMLAGHCDQIGLLVKHIDEFGFLRVQPIGGWDPLMLIGQKLQIWTENGPVNGVIARKPIHLLTDEERSKIPKIAEMWIDIGARDENEAREVVAIGDPVTLDLGFRELRNGLATAPGMDNRVGVWVVMSALKQVSQGNPDAAVYAVSTVQEEIGLRGAKTSAFSIDPHLGIAVDVTHATDCPTIEEGEHGRVHVGAGPVLFRGPNINPIVFRDLMSLAKEHSIPVQPNGFHRAASNDGNALQINRGGVATGIVALPNRYMHSPVEVISLDDLENAAKLIGHFCLSVSENSDFTPHCSSG